MHYSFSGSLLLSIAGMMIVVVRGSDLRGTNNYFLHYLMGKVWQINNKGPVIQKFLKQFSFKIQKEYFFVWQVRRGKEWLRFKLFQIK